MKTWTVDDVADELATLFVMDSNRRDEGWMDGSSGCGRGEFLLILGDTVFAVKVEET